VNHAPFYASGLAAIIPVFAGIGQQGNVAGTFDLAGYCALVACTGTGLAARADFAIVGNITAQQVCVFVVDHDIFVSAKLADFRARVKVVRTFSKRTRVSSHNLLQKFYRI